MGRPALPSQMPFPAMPFPWLADEFAEQKLHLPGDCNMSAGIDQTSAWVPHNRYTRWVQAGKPELEGWEDYGVEGKEKGGEDGGEEGKAGEEGGEEGYEGDDEKGLE
ncbi:unnamed protein product [Zymoseptoria tritici ST99CH_1A5]|uniref:Uncharacterized protein n=1 Tax=Zymoseptoria tritici ST99CH_1A5 TaxID=1276529 RepID=A0A1Y6LZJ6_ZYMTR|nr:unnamed protein product [Zymoseptoria tritici ST99CH_3D1]SMY28848.1 unnamed protein product [Zymoseptoria tritici ST99CH_1A5]